MHQVYKEREDVTGVGIVKDTTSSIIETLANLVPGSKILSSIRTSSDINIRNTAVNPDDPAWVQGLNEGLNKLYNKTPGLSGTLPLAKNWRYEAIDVEYPLSPLKAKEAVSIEPEATSPVKPEPSPKNEPEKEPEAVPIAELPWGPGVLINNTAGLV
jgi:hypothetical protein